MMNAIDKDKLEIEIITEEKKGKGPNEIIITQYSKGRQIGKGGFAKCFEFTCLDNNNITAAKVIPKSTLTKQRAKQKLISEIKIHKAIHHSNIVGFEHYFEDHSNVYLLLELCHNQTLNELLKRRKSLTELEVQYYVVQIIKGLLYLHSHRIIHRDLKLGNLFLSQNMEIKLGDFGLATKLDYEGERKKTVCGTPNYIAPEILERSDGHSYEVDIWSLGVIIYTLIIGKPPFETSNVKETYKRIKAVQYTFPNNAVISTPAKELIINILVLDPAMRPSLNQILQSDFMKMGTSIPKQLPTSTLSCPPNLSYIRQYIPQAGNANVNANPTILPKALVKVKTVSEDNNNNNIIHTDRQNKGVAPLGSANSLGENSTRPYTSNNNLNNINININMNPNISSQVSTGSRLGTGRLSNIQSNPSLKSNTFITPSASINPSVKPLTSTQYNKNEITVLKWFDFTSQYGLVYILSNKQLGIYFNDSTKILYYPKGINFAYIERKPSENIEIITTHLLNEAFSRDLSKKVQLINHFYEYLSAKSLLPFTDYIPNTYVDENNCVYVKKWVKTKHAILFRLSNKLVQVYFKDDSQIILSSVTKMVTYVDRQGERFPFQLYSALESENTEMTKRLKYTKNILTSMLSSHTAPANNNANANAANNN